MLVGRNLLLLAIRYGAVHICVPCVSYVYDSERWCRNGYYVELQVPRECICACVVDGCSGQRRHLLMHLLDGVPTYGTCVESTLILAFTWAAAGNCTSPIIHLHSFAHSLQSSSTSRRCSLLPSCTKDIVLVSGKPTPPNSPGSPPAAGRAGHHPPRSSSSRPSSTPVVFGAALTASPSPPSVCTAPRTRDPRWRSRGRSRQRTSRRRRRYPPGSRRPHGCAARSCPLAQLPRGRGRPRRGLGSPRRGCLGCIGRPRWTCRRLVVHGRQDCSRNLWMRRCTSLVAVCNTDSYALLH